MSSNRKPGRLGIVVPCYNETAVLNTTCQVLSCVLDNLISKHKISEDSFVCFADDGSTDGTWDLIQELHEKSPFRVFGAKLTRNMGHQYALMAGLETCVDRTDMIISIDADLQDDTVVIESMIDKYNSGIDIVYGVRKSRQKDSFLKRVTAQGYYKFLKLMGVNIVYNHADFRLMSRRAVQGLLEYRETNLFLRGLVPLIGYSSDVVYYDRKTRFAGESKYTPGKMLRLAFDGISSLSCRPMDLIFGLGFVLSGFGLLSLIVAGIVQIVSGSVAVWVWVLLSLWFLGGVQVFCIGLVGEYVGRAYLESKRRPRYRIEKKLFPENENSA